MDGLHEREDVRRRTIGAPEKAVIMLHGRGATADGFLQLADRVVDDAVVLAPQAHRRTWYPESFMAERDANQPWLDAALERVEAMLRLAEQEGYGTGSVFLVGFSQGACLATEFAATRPDRYGGVFGLSGGLIGPEIEDERYTGELEGTPVFLGCSDDDPHIPLERVKKTTEVFERMDAGVEERIYPGMGHTINEDEVSVLQEYLG
jgi:phospholipase/carboxylesterase